MNLLYIANIRFPTERAHGIQIAEMCNAFADMGISVELVVHRRFNDIEEDAFTYYHLPKSFRITELATLDTLQYAWTGILGRVGYVIQTGISAFNEFRYALGGDAIIYSRDEAVLYLLSFFGRNFAYEVHAPKWNFLTRRVVRKAGLIFPISQGLKNFYVQKGVASERLIVVPDAVNLAQFSVSESRESCRKQLDLPLDKKIVLYAGHLYARKGAFVVGDAAPLLDENVLAVFVGGTEDEIPDFTKRYGGDPHVRILGPKRHAMIPYYLRAADVLVLPNTATDADARLYTSPMKLFEYMASSTPIIASDVPSLREILDERTAYFSPPDDARALAGTIAHVLSQEEEADEKARSAKKCVESYTWENRAKNIMNAILAVTNSSK
jgi:glycosyltransferase involved in cell wall biosynthesis